MDTQEAVRKAKSVGLDLVEVSSNAKPPVCKIVDYGKYKYDQKKLRKEQPKKTSRLKEVKFRVGIDSNDYNIKVTRAESFLMQEDKVRVQLMFRGRQMAHKEIGFELMNEVKEDLSGVSHVDLEPKLTGRNITMMLSPLAKHLQKPKFKNHDDLPDEEDEEGGHQFKNQIDIEDCAKVVLGRVLAVKILKNVAGCLEFLCACAMPTAFFSDSG